MHAECSSHAKYTWYAFCYVCRYIQVLCTCSNTSVVVLSHWSVGLSDCNWDELDQITLNTYSVYSSIVHVWPGCHGHGYHGAAQLIVLLSNLIVSLSVKKLIRQSRLPWQWLPWPWLPWCCPVYCATVSLNCQLIWQKANLDKPGQPLYGLVQIVLLCHCIIIIIYTS